MSGHGIWGTMGNSEQSGLRVQAPAADQLTSHTRGEKAILGVTELRDEGHDLMKDLATHWRSAARGRLFFCIRDRVRSFSTGLSPILATSGNVIDEIHTAYPGVAKT